MVCGITMLPNWKYIDQLQVDKVLNIGNFELKILKKFLSSDPRCQVADIDSRSDSHAPSEKKVSLSDFNWKLRALKWIYVSKQTD